MGILGKTSESIFRTRRATYIETSSGLSRSSIMSSIVVDGNGSSATLRRSDRSRIERASWSWCSCSAIRRPSFLNVATFLDRNVAGVCALVRENQSNHQADRAGTHQDVADCGQVDAGNTVVDGERQN